MDAWREIIYATTHTRYPVCEGSADNVIGILNAKEYFRLEDQSRESVMEKAVIPAYFVPDTIKADTLFRNMKKEKRQLAVVLDEYGGMTGIVTINDLVEQLVGDLGDEEDEEEKLIEKLDQNTWQVNGSITLEELSKELGVVLKDEEYETLNGLIFDVAGTIPEEGEDIELPDAGISIKVLRIENRQIEKALIKK